MTTISDRGISAGQLRRANLASVLRAVCAARQPPTRAELAGRLGVTRATAVRLVDELVDAGFVDEADPAEARRGRPAKLLLPGHGVATLGLLIDVDRVVAQVSDLAGSTVAHAQRRVDLSERSIDDGLELARDVVREALAYVGRVQVLTGAVAVPGIVSGRRRLVHGANLHWREIDLVTALHDLRLIESVGNEADLAAWTLVQDRPGRMVGSSSYLYVAAGQGIGGAIVREGRVSDDLGGFSGEIGHICVDPTGPACSCGSTGCLECFASVPALRAEGIEIGADGADGAAIVLSPAARERLEWALTVGLASALNVTGLRAVVLGGHLGALVPQLSTLAPRVAERVVGAQAGSVTVRAAATPADASAIGAAWSALDRVIADPVSWI